MFRFAKPLAEEPPTASSSLVTVVLTNWKRPKNLKKIIDSLAAQTVKPVLFLWNNGAKFSHPALQWTADSSQNMACWPRWWMASAAQTEFVCVMDDDLIVTDARVLEDMVAALKTKPEHSIVGLFGMKLDPEKEYRFGAQVWPSKDADQPADIIKGRFMMMRTAALKAVHLKPSPSRDTLIGDDIVVSGALAEGKPGMHTVPGCFLGRWIELPHDHAVSAASDHWAHRERARRASFHY